MDKSALQYLATILKDDVLRFGEFKTKSGRTSPYFFNTGRICSAHSIGTVAEAYAQKILSSFGVEVANFFGPAYKGIPLAVATSEKFAALTGSNVTYTFNRKEAKDHGEGGTFVGASYDQPTNVVIVEDVLTAGTSLRESAELLSKQNVTILGAIVGIDRQERGETGNSAASEITEHYGFPIVSIVDLESIVEALHNKTVLGKVWIDDEMKEKIDSYRAEYCAKS